jgi:hypothetical protein
MLEDEEREKLAEAMRPDLQAFLERTDSQADAFLARIRLISQSTSNPIPSSCVSMPCV